MDQLAKSFPPGLKYTIIYNPTQFIQQSVNAVTETIGEAVILVVLVVILFLQTWRAAVIPLVAIPDIADRHLLRDGDVRLLAEQSLAVRPGAGDRHRGGRRHRRGRERRAQHRRRPVAARCGQEKHGRGRIGAHRHRARAVRRVRAVGLHHRHFGAVLPAVRADDCRRDRHFPHRFAHALARHVRAAPEAAHERPSAGPLVDATDPWLLPHLQRGLRQAGRRLRLVRRAHRAGGGGDAGGIRGDPGLRPQRVPQDAGRVHPAAGCGLPDRRDAAARRRVAGAHRRGQSPRRRHRPEDAGCGACGEHRRILRRHLHQRPERGRRVLRARAVRGARRRSAKVRRRHPGRAVPAACRHPGSAGAGGAAAAGARRRQCRRRAHDDPGPGGSRPARAAGRRRRP